MFYFNDTADAFASCLRKAENRFTVNLQTEIFNYEESALKNVDEYVVYCCRRSSTRETAKNHSTEASGPAWHILFAFLKGELTERCVITAHTRPLWDFVIAVGGK